ncbi:MAG: hypothetical protein GY862_19450 [Gammaproteobacteria bacterium]|nr:hypothetical protein [Gammaproteobacteria bacterium]
METISRTLMIPEDHRINLTLPDSIPAGEAEIILVIHPKSAIANKKTLSKIRENPPYSVNDPAKARKYPRKGPETNEKRPSEHLTLADFSFEESRNLLKEIKGTLSDVVIEERRSAL